MSILIKDMDMPESCMACELVAWNDETGLVCPLTGVMALNIGRQDDCPLINVPPSRPVIFSSGRGEWILEEDRRNHWHCSVCGTVFGIVSQTYQYCPHCGSYMTNPLYPFDPFRAEREDEDECSD